jgi:hypothetical protein
MLFHPDFWGRSGGTMMFLLASFILIFLLSSSVVCYTYTKRKYLSSMIGMIGSMTNSMMTSLAIGTFLGISIQDKDLTIPTIISVSIGMILGYVTGRPISLLVSLDGLTAGIMGGMMGAMLGVMLPPQSSELMVYFIDVIDVIINVLLLRAMDEEIKTKQKEPSNDKPLIAKLIVFIAFLILIVLLVKLNLILFSG